jgi:hypothetical protein
MDLPGADYLSHQALRIQTIQGQIIAIEPVLG